MYIHQQRKELFVFTMYAVVYIFIVAIFSLVIKHNPLPIFGAKGFTEDGWYVFFIKLVFLFLVPLYMYRRFGYSIRSIFHLQEPKRWILVFSCFMVGILLNSGYFGEIFSVMATGGEFIWIKLLLGLLLPLVQAALPEEIFYRYILQTRLEKAIGAFAGIVLSAILFSLFHLPSRYLLASGVEGIAGDLSSILLGTILPAFVIGIILGYLWYKFRNIWILIALHYGIDILPSGASFLNILH
ncbi:CPBP family intramembrane metalloprotease [Paenibacillus sp. MER TA 81-3]|uniref:CPBP family intramembrane glutamic endopeptidase n=1 Tax=Paenibacillus sp. MER TA 81-3 TaxID=2939573 RepID=UPI00204236AA|nr:type II CAAX endopeptidase family protein [Paenibacillus sp. MER TA 81-3]MCM3340558.1 CPBP family intramembrane metalloprotease [Paenibacillus sp. MER TA 81-3]